MEQQQSPRVGISKIYVKDLSFESPSAPGVFQQEFQPQVGLDIQVEAKHLQDKFHEVTLQLTAEAKGQDGNVYFIVEIEQSGLFTIDSENDDQKDKLLKVFCPSVLFPYARQSIDTALNMGGFPPLMLAPLNFEQMAEAK